MSLINSEVSPLALRIPLTARSVLLLGTGLPETPTMMGDISRGL